MQKKTPNTMYSNFFFQSYFIILRIQYAKIKTNFKYQIIKLTSDNIKISKV